MLALSPLAVAWANDVEVCGAMTLNATVKTWAQREAVERVAWIAEGGNQVRHQITIRPQAAALDRGTGGALRNRHRHGSLASGLPLPESVVSF